MDTKPPLSIDARTRFREAGSSTRNGTKSRASADTLEWRREQRWRALTLVAKRARGLHWAPALMQLLLEELWVDEEFKHLVDRVHKLRPSQYPRAVAVAVVLRHSWQRDDLRRTARRLGISTRGL